MFDRRAANSCYRQPARGNGTAPSIHGVTRIWRFALPRLWRTERTGILYQRSLFEDQGDALGAEQALDRMLHEILG